MAAQPQLVLGEQFVGGRSRCSSSQMRAASTKAASTPANGTPRAEPDRPAQLLDHLLRVSTTLPRTAEQVGEDQQVELVRLEVDVEGTGAHPAQRGVAGGRQRAA